MIREAITYLSTSCPAYARRMGYLKEAISIEARYRRCAGSWRPHLERTKKAVMHAVAQCPSKRKVVVLGAGPFLDLPLDGLSNAFSEVVLADVLFLGSAVRQVRRFDNVQTVLCDVTGVAMALHNMGQEGPVNLPGPSAVIPESDSADLVISLNLLSQLPLVPRGYITKKPGWTDADALDTWGRRVINAHIEGLQSCKGIACLITDTHTVLRDRQGNEVERISMLCDIGLPPAFDSWQWDFAPFGEISKDIREERTIVAVMMGGL